MTHRHTSWGPMIVRAHLSAGIAHAAPWGIALDGLIASEIWSDYKAVSHAHETRALEQDNPPDLDLPLARCELTPEGWHWAATCAFPAPVPSNRIDVHTWTGRVDHRHLEQTTQYLPRVVSDRQGRFRARRMPLLVTPTASITWHAIGDVTAIRSLLGSVATIGKKRTSGEGHVLAWEVLAAPHLDPFLASHLHPNSTLGRPTPAGCLAGRNIPDGGCGRAGLRPPYMHRSRQHDLHLPAT